MRSSTSEPRAPATQPAGVAYELVLRHAGASRRRDAADARLVAGVRDRSHRMINSQDEVGGWPTLASEPAPRRHRSRRDARRLGAGPRPRPDDPGDRNGDRDGDGYTNLEEYLNSLCTPEYPWAQGSTGSRHPRANTRTLLAGSTSEAEWPKPCIGDGSAKTRPPLPATFGLTQFS